MIQPINTAELPVEDFTHAVFGEEFTATWCVYCPSAAENLMKVYEDVPDEPYYDDKFFFVALITDVNDKADDRMGDYPDVVTLLVPLAVPYWRVRLHWQADTYHQFSSRTLA